jgi:hypothetical protein
MIPMLIDIPFSNQTGTAFLISNQAEAAFLISNQAEAAFSPVTAHYGHG